jgi:hypothetical protein
MSSFWSGLAGGLSPGLMSAASQYAQDQGQTKYADAMFDVLKDQPGVVSEDVLKKYATMSGKEKSAAVLAAQYRYSLQAQQQAQQDAVYKRREQIANTNAAIFKNAQTAAGPTTGTTLNPVTGQPVATITLGPGNTQVLKDTPQAQPPGTIFKDETGKRVGVWGPDGKIIRDQAMNPFMSLFGGPTGGGAGGDLVTDPNADAGGGAAAPQAAPAGTPVVPQAAPAPAAAGPAASARIQVRSPDGKVGSIPAGQLPAALQAGYTRI